MITNGYSLSVSEVAELHNFKKGPGYGAYLKAISTSPAYKAIMNEHIKNVDVTPDVKQLKDEGKLPDSIDPKALSELFKLSLQRMAICIVADTIILKELEDTKVEEVINDITADFDTTYLLGKADKKFYDQAKRLAEQGKLDKESLAFKGLLNYLKQTGKITEKVTNLQELDPPAKSEPLKEKSAPAKKVDFNSNDIEL